MNSHIDIESSDHDWFTDRIAARAIDALSPAELQRFDEHATGCAECTSELAAIRSIDSHFREAVGSRRATDGIEDRMVAAFRNGSRRSIAPWLSRVQIDAVLARATTGIAAVLAIGAFGYVGERMLESTASRPVKMASNFRQLGQAVLLYSNDFKTVPMANTENWDFGGGANTALDWSNWNSKNTEGVGGNLTYDSKTNVLSNNRDEDSGNVVYGDGHVSFEQKPFVGVQRDNVYAKAKAPASTDKESALAASTAGDLYSPKDSNDAVLLPSDNDGDKPSREHQSTTAVGSDRKVIRNGQLDFEVNRFDDAVMKVTSLVADAKGFVATTNSEKLPNGHVKGVVVLRIPPVELDEFLGKLRVVGELKKQSVTADDVTKQFTDTESELRADKAMQDRLLELIKSANGEIKDLLAAEKELAVWREKIEKAQGELNYFNNLVSLSTVTITLAERDIAAPAAIVQTESIDVSLEAIDVSTARDEIAKAVDAAKGRVLVSQLKQQAAGQFAASLVFEVAADQTSVVLDRCRQLGRIDHLESQQQAAAVNGTADATNIAPASQPTHIEKRAARINLSIYNVANLSPRTVTSVRLACKDVERANVELVQRANNAKAKVVSSSINTARNGQTLGGAVLRIELPSADADAFLATLAGEKAIAGATVVQTDSATADANVAQSTTEKRGIELTLQSIDALPPGQTSQVRVESNQIGNALATITASALQAGGRVVGSTADQSADGAGAATITVDVPGDQVAHLLDAVKSNGTIRATRTSTPDVPTSVSNASVLRTRLQFELTTPSTIVESNDGIGATLRRGLSTSVAGLLWSLKLIVIGLCLILPWAVMAWIGARFGKRFIVAMKR